MVDRHIRDRGITDKLVLRAMYGVPRHLFLPERLADEAYMDRPVPIGKGQTISQPYIVAYMIEALELNGGEKVLEIGAGSGYASAVLAEIASEVYGVERIEALAKRARSTLKECGYKNVEILHDDGSRGWLDQAPYDAILVSAAATDIPEALKSQLKIGGRMIIPVDTDHHGQDLIRLTRLSEDKFKSDTLVGVRFVPLIKDGSNHG
jgi:protein-L-isoaspartate(D-aspartate) O-methyltransferase